MRTGTPQFIGERLREAREARAITANDLAAHLLVSPQAVSQYERGKQTPSPDVLRRAADALDVPSHFFLRPIQPEEPEILFFRSLSSATKRDRVRAARQYRWLRDIVQFLHGFVEFPSIQFPSICQTDDPRELRDDDIENAATTLRRSWGLGDGPISNVVWLAENHGAVIARQQLNSAALDAFSNWNSDATPYIVLGTEKASAVRARFNIAHEIGHLILHRNVSQATFNSPPLFKLIEEQANRFASAFLLPAVTFSASIYSVSLDAFRAMKDQWKVSIGAMILRAAQLGLINEMQTTRLFINRNRRGWNVQEPLDEVLIPEEPRFMRRAFDLLIENGLISWQEMELQIARRPADVEALVGLPRGYLSHEPKGVRLKIQPAEGHAYEWKDSENWVLPFMKDDPKVG